MPNFFSDVDLDFFWGGGAACFFFWVWDACESDYLLLLRMWMVSLGKG